MHPAVQTIHVEVQFENRAGDTVRTLASLDRESADTFVVRNEMDVSVLDERFVEAVNQVLRELKPFHEGITFIGLV